MKIALVTQYFWPESFSINDLILELTNQGHEVDIYTGKPNYPDGNIFDGYKYEECQQEKYISKVNIYRVPLRPRGKGGAKNLVLNYLSFVWNGLLHFNKLRNNKKYDYIFVYATSPITAAIPAIYLKYKMKIPLAIWVLDLWPESLKTTGYIKNKYALGAVSILVKWIYSCADKILVQSEAFIDAVAQYADRNKIEYFSNFSIDLAKKSIENNNIPENIINILENNFCYVFAGNLGTAQSIETLIDASEKLKHIKQIRIVFVGSGSRSEWLEKVVKERRLENVIIAGRYPADQMLHGISRSEGFIVSLKNEDIYNRTIPAKIQTYLSSGKPIIASLNGEGAKVIEKAQAGYICKAETPEDLANIMIKLFHDSELTRDKFGKNGREFFLKNFEINKQAKYLIELLKK